MAPPTKKGSDTQCGRNGMGAGGDHTVAFGSMVVYQAQLNRLGLKSFK